MGLLRLRKCPSYHIEDGWGTGDRDRSLAEDED